MADRATVITAGQSPASRDVRLSLAFATRRNDAAGAQCIVRIPLQAERSLLVP